MTFLAPAALFGAALLAIPILVHLFKPRKMRHVPFSSLRWLKETRQRLSRRMQWHQVLLFLLRAGCILVLVLALAKPLIGFRGTSRPIDRFVILDGSRSMAYQVRDLPSSWETAQELASRFLKNAGPGERVSLIVTGQPTRLITPPVADGSPHLAYVAAARPSQADTSLSAALPLVKSLLPQNGERDVELVFLTDNLKQRWQQGALQAFRKDLGDAVRIKVVDAGPGMAQNAWISQARLISFGQGEDSRIRVGVACVGEAKQSRTVRLTGIKDVEDQTQEVVLKSGELSRVDFRVPSSVNLRGQVAECRLEPTDALGSDDRYFLNLDVSWAVRVLLVEPDTASADGRSVGLYLRAGMEALASSKQQALDVTGRTVSTVASGDIRNADVVILAGVPELSDAALESLENRVRTGAGLVVFLGPHLKPAFYNQRLHRHLQPTEGLLPLPLKADSDVLDAKEKQGRLTNIRWTHPLLAQLHDPIFSDFSQSRFRICIPFVGTPLKSETVLARIDGDAPAILERAVGAGRVVVLNTTANDDWSDLPRRKSFVPLLDRLLSYLTAGSLQRSFIVGDSINLPLFDHSPGDKVIVLTPSGDKLTPQLIPQRGQTLLHLDDVSAPGTYTVEGAGKNFAFVVNTARGDSSLSHMDNKVLEQWWAPLSFEMLRGDSAVQSRDHSTNNWPVWPAFILVASVLLIVETVYVSRLCPRANPKVTA